MSVKRITIDRHTLEVSIVTDKPSRGLSVQAARGQKQTSAIKRFANGHLLKVLEKMERKGVDERVQFCLPAPDPWLIALGLIMWEGIIQGASWDAVKALVSAALTKMRAEGVAPKRTAGASEYSETQLGFAWTGNETGRKRQEVFFGLKMVHDKKRESKANRKGTSDKRQK